MTDSDRKIEPMDLPDGWPTAAGGLKHKELDKYEIPRQRAGQDLKLVDRQEIYRTKYLDGVDKHETMTDKAKPKGQGAGGAKARTLDQLPAGWPSETRGLTHEDLDKYDIPRKYGKKQTTLTLDQRRNRYRIKYLRTADERAKDRGTEWGCAAVLFTIVVGGAALFYSCKGADDPSVPSTDYSTGKTEGAAWEACKDSVELQLKAPATADFPSITAGSFLGNPDKRQVTGYVDSENSYGAQIRTQWACTATWHDGDPGYYVGDAVLVG